MKIDRTIPERLHPETLVRMLQSSSCNGDALRQEMVHRWNTYTGILDALKACEGPARVRAAMRHGTVLEGAAKKHLERVLKALRKAERKEP